MKSRQKKRTSQKFIREIKGVSGSKCFDKHPLTIVKSKSTCIGWTLTTELETIYLTIYPQVNGRLSAHHGIQKSTLETWSYEMLINDTDNRCNSKSSYNPVNLSPCYKLYIIACIFTLLLFYSVKPAVASGRKISPVSCHFKLSRRERFFNIS